MNFLLGFLLGSLASTNPEASNIAEKETKGPGCLDLLVFPLKVPLNEFSFSSLFTRTILLLSSPALLLVILEFFAGELAGSTNLMVQAFLSAKVFLKAFLLFLASAVVIMGLYILSIILVRIFLNWAMFRLNR